MLRHRKISERMDIKMKNNKRYFISFTVILSIVMFSFISSVAVFASENIFTDGTELDISENKKTNLYNVDNTANENDFISEIEESEMSKTVLNEENIDPKELHAFNYNYINGIMSIPIKMSTFFGNSEHPFPEK